MVRMEVAERWYREVDIGLPSVRRDGDKKVIHKARAMSVQLCHLSGNCQGKTTMTL